jgi:rod shape determining protein RodA
MISGSFSGRVRDHFDWPLFIAAAMIAVLGVINLYSATSVYQGARSELYISQVQ